MAKQPFRRSCERVFEEHSRTGLTVIAGSLTLLIVFGGSIVVSGVWFVCQFLEWFNLSVRLPYEITCWIFYWSGILVANGARAEVDLSVVITSCLLWFHIFFCPLQLGKTLVQFRRC